MKPLPTPTLAEAQLHAAKIGLSDLEAQKCFYYYESVGWRTKVGPLKNWHAAMTGWKLRAQSFVQNKQGYVRPLYVSEIAAVIKAKDAMANELRNNYAHESPTGWEWQDEARRQEWRTMRKQIKDLNQQLAQSA